MSQVIHKKCTTFQGDIVLLDAIDYYNFCFRKLNTKYSYDRTRKYITVNRDKKSYYIHRLILEAKKGQHVDHINHNTLDNRRSNLRLCSCSNNSANQKTQIRKKQGKCQSRYKGVYWSYKLQKWYVQIGVRKTRVCLGHFEEEILAHIAYKRAAKKYFGDFAYAGNTQKM